MQGPYKPWGAPFDDGPARTRMQCLQIADSADGQESSSPMESHLGFEDGEVSKSGTFLVPLTSVRDDRQPCVGRPRRGCAQLHLSRRRVLSTQFATFIST